MHFIKYLKWLNKGRNFAMLTPISKEYEPSCSLSREECKISLLFFCSNVFVCYKHWLMSENDIYLSVLSHVMAIFM